jgi:uncharacterized protein (TIGR00369 family)
VLRGWTAAAACGSLAAMLDPSAPDGGFADLVGYRLVAWRDGEAELAMQVGPQHLNRSGVLHGGVVTTLLDAACGFAGCYCAVPGRVRRAVTLSLTTHFVGQVTGGGLRATARLNGGGRRIFSVVAEVYDDTGALVAHALGMFRYRSGSENPDGVPAEVAAQ